MSDSIYRTAKKDMKSFTKILVRYDFPSIDRKIWKSFCDELIRMLENARLKEKVGDVIEMLGKKILLLTKKNLGIFKIL